MHDPYTLAFSFPPYPSGGSPMLGHPQPWSFGRFLYRLKPFIGLDVWHVDPERSGTGNRTDDSCGWFERGAKEYTDAVAYLLKDKELMWEVRRALNGRSDAMGPYGHVYPRLSLADTLAVTLMVARYLELRRWWNGQDGKGGAHASRWLRTFTRKRRVDEVAFQLALNPLDNLSSIDEPQGLVRLIAAALHRHFRPWWKHPRWHVHHWKINVDFARNLRRMLIDRCAGCGKRLGWAYSPVSSGWSDDAPVYHHECYGQVALASVDGRRMVETRSKARGEARPARSREAGDAR